MGTRRGLTLLELLGCMAMIAGFTAGLALGARHGKVPALLCAGFGLAAAPLVLMLLGTALDLFFRLQERRRPPRPVCFAGPCDFERYTWTEVDELHGIGWRCACGDRYVERDDRFLRVVADDVALAYMVKDAKGRWHPESRRAA
jgi:hypothetical protein